MLNSNGSILIKNYCKAEKCAFEKSRYFQLAFNAFQTRFTGLINEYRVQVVVDL